MSAHLTGGCGCGAVKFEISAPLSGAAYCHCTRCQSRTGGATSATGSSSRDPSRCSRTRISSRLEDIPDDGLPRFDEALPRQ